MVGFVKVIKSGDKRAREDLPMYGGKMDDEVLIDWFNAMEFFFECEDVEEGHKLKISK